MEAFLSKVLKNVENNFFSAAHFLKFNANLPGFCSVLLEGVPMANLLKYAMAAFFRPHVTTKLFGRLFYKF